MDVHALQSYFDSYDFYITHNYSYNNYIHYNKATFPHSTGRHNARGILRVLTSKRACGRSLT